MTYDEIMERMLESVTEDVDTREGSLIYTALAPAAFELAQMYIELEGWLELAFAHTSSGDYLEKRCAELGLERSEATYATRKGEFDVKVDIGARFGLNSLYYTVTEYIEDYNYKLVCETAGEVGNTDFGTLLPVDYIDGLTSATLSDVLIPGEDEESDTALLARFDTKVSQSATSGNKNHYLTWAAEVDGVGAARVIPIWNGDNTVKVLIVGSDMQEASSTLIESVQDYIDPDSEGLGYGEAPIGAVVTVDSASATSIDITADITDTTESEVIDAFKESLESYFEELITENWQTDDSFVVSYAKIGSLLLAAITDVGGTDYSNLSINNGTSNIQMTDDFTIVGTVTLSVT